MSKFKGMIADQSQAGRGGELALAVLILSFVTVLFTAGIWVNLVLPSYNLTVNGEYPVKNITLYEDSPLGHGRSFWRVTAVLPSHDVVDVNVPLSEIAQLNYLA